MKKSVSPAEFPDLLRDESQLQGEAELLWQPESVADLVALLKELAAEELPITLQGARTGIAGGGVPQGGALISLAKLDRITALRFAADDRVLLRVEPGVTLKALRSWLQRPTSLPGVAQETWRRFRSRAWRFTPDPTEQSASLGGMVACNASGACTFLHGATRYWIEEIDLALVDGREITLSRTHGPFVTAGRFEVTARDGSRLAGELPLITLPNVKHAAGYWLQREMPLLDLFIGSEGTLGVVTGVELALIPEPAGRMGITLLLKDEATALQLVKEIRLQAGKERREIGAALAAMEYFDGAALALLRKVAAAAESQPEWPVPPPEAGCALYLEVEGEASGEADLLQAGTTIMQLLQTAGGDPLATWAVTNETELEHLKAFRHAVPEMVNQTIAHRRHSIPGLTKIGTDFAVPDEALAEVVTLYRNGVMREGLEAVIFGHIGNNHLHVNILPRDEDELKRARLLTGEWAARVVAMGGTVSAEHGLGKLKRKLLPLLYGDKAVAAMCCLKRLFDPAWRLNGGTLLALTE